MYDSYNREITYLRISVTDRCNLRCRYCMPAGGVKSIDREHILTFEEIAAVVRTLAPLGICKIRLTGGEPLMRRGLEELVGRISPVPGIRETTLTTNGTRLEPLASKLADRGLDRVNVSLDTLDPVKYREITRGGDIGPVIRGIGAAQKAGLDPVKINCVVAPETTVEELYDLDRFCSANGLELRLIRKMDLVKGRFWKVAGGEGGICTLCNRIRLTADGSFLPCLFSDKEFGIREHGIEDAFRMAVADKPRKGIVNPGNTFYRIGG